MLAIRSSVEPDVRTYIDHKERNLTVEVVLPGVKTETISLKVNDSSLFVQASARDACYVKYMLLHHPVLYRRARAVLRRDRLCVTLPLRG
jgi:HSP20 family molecular chaperone IbpA